MYCLLSFNINALNMVNKYLLSYCKVLSVFFRNVFESLNQSFEAIYYNQPFKLIFSNESNINFATKTSAQPSALSYLQVMRKDWIKLLLYSL